MPRDAERRPLIRTYDFMISVQLHGQHFQVRSAAVVLHDGFVLLHQAPGDEYWALPGGRVEVGEDASATVVREMMEELGETVHCGRLLHIAENFFDLNGQRNHEIGFYFLVSLGSDSPYLNKTHTYYGIESDVKLEFRWFPACALGSVNLRPTFLKASLAVGPPTFSHEIQREYE
jgi:8-oxo-dGTP pyrophosphatase MutT (NUDIX family)